MRVLLAIDGSRSSDTARDLVASLDWQSGTIIRIIGVTTRVPTRVGSFSPFVVSDGDHATAARALGTRLSDAAARIGRPGRVVETRLTHGDAADRIAAEASEWRPELVVVGSRGLGRIGCIALGSVSADVVDRVPCPVLVARVPSIGTILFATNGSPAARAAAEHLGNARHLAGHRIEVLSVNGSSSSAGLLARHRATDTPRESCTDLTSGERQSTEIRAAMAARELKRDGCDVRWSIAEGEPASEIVDTAAALGCDLVVVGSRGMAGLERYLFGSTSRDVLLRTRASVLVVREPVRQIQRGRRARVAPRATLALSWPF